MKPLRFGQINDMPRGWCGASLHNSKIHDMWARIWGRCHKEFNYFGVTIFQEWKYLSNFVKWVESQPNYEDFKANPKGWSIEKDAIRKNNRVYCPKYCILTSVTNNTKERNTRLGNPMSNDESKVKMGLKHRKARIGIPINVGPIYALDKLEDGYKFGFTDDISKCCTGKTKSHKGYKWYYLKVEEL